MLEEYYPALTAHLQAQGTELPAYVQREFEEYLRYGRLEQGSLRVRCGSGHCTELLHCGVSLIWTSLDRQASAMCRGGQRAYIRPLIGDSVIAGPRWDPHLSALAFGRH